MDGLNQKTLNNGCGACGGFWKWFKPPHHNFFKDDCDIHDILYSKGGNFKDRLTADRILLKHMLKRVTNHFYKRKPISRLWFYNICLMYYLAVRVVGITRFNLKDEENTRP